MSPYGAKGLENKKEKDLRKKIVKILKKSFKKFKEYLNDLERGELYSD